MWCLVLNVKHDQTVASVMNAMKIFNGIQPPYASSIMVELFNVSGQFYVELWYKNDSTRDPYQLVVPGTRRSLLTYYIFIILMNKW
jgi:lysosomal acid phosphatase